MNRYRRAVLVCAALMILLLPVSARADIGPKMGIKIKFVNLTDEVCYVTLLSENRDTYGYSAEAALEIADDPTRPDAAVYQAFLRFPELGDDYVLDSYQECSDGRYFGTHYIPDGKFRILIYYPNRDSYAVSGKLRLYAFSSYYTAWLPEDALPAPGQTAHMRAVYSYPFMLQGLLFRLRLAITVGIELLIALMFRFTEKRQIRLVAVVNLATQLALNLVVNLAAFWYGGFGGAALFIIGELLVWIAEAIIYARRMPRVSEKRVYAILCVLYALIANIVTCLAGFLSFLIPPI